MRAFFSPHALQRASGTAPRTVSEVTHPKVSMTRHAPAVEAPGIRMLSGSMRPTASPGETEVGEEELKVSPLAGPSAANQADRPESCEVGA